MSEGTPDKQQLRPLGPFGAYGLIAFCCSVATIFIAGIVSTIVNRWTTFDSSALFAVATMVACPAFLGVGISFFVAKTASLQSKGLDRLD